MARIKADEAGVSLREFVQGNALDLSRFPEGSFDAVLLLGQLYHLTQPAERGRAVREALRVLKPGGPLFAALITIYAPFRDAIARGYLKNFSYSDLPLEVWVSRFAPRLLHFHLHDNDRSGDRHWPIGRGTIDFDAFYAAVRRYTPSATLSLEVEDSMEVKLPNLRALAAIFPQG